MSDVSSLLASSASASLLSQERGEVALRDYIASLPAANDGQRTLLVYFSASWCGPCKVFTPQLAGIVAQLKSFGVVFVSADSSRSDFDAYRASMSWPAVPYKSPLAKALESAFSVSSFPTLVALTLTPASAGSELDGFPWRATLSNPNAYRAVSAEGAGGFPWGDPAAAAAAAAKEDARDGRVGEGGSGIDGLWVGALSGPPLPMQLLPLPASTAAVSSSSSSAAAEVKTVLSRRVHLAAAARFRDPPSGDAVNANSIVVGAQSANVGGIPVLLLVTAHSAPVPSASADSQRWDVSLRLQAWVRAPRLGSPAAGLGGQGGCLVPVAPLSPDGGFDLGRLPAALACVADAVAGVKQLLTVIGTVPETEGGCVLFTLPNALAQGVTVWSLHVSPQTSAEAPAAWQGSVAAAGTVSTRRLPTSCAALPLVSTPPTEAEAEAETEAVGVTALVTAEADGVARVYPLTIALTPASSPKSVRARAGAVVASIPLPDGCALLASASPRASPVVAVLGATRSQSLARQEGVWPLPAAAGASALLTRPLSLPRTEKIPQEEPKVVCEGDVCRRVPATGRARKDSAAAVAVVSGFVCVAMARAAAVSFVELCFSRAGAWACSVADASFVSSSPSLAVPAGASSTTTGLTVAPHPLGFLFSEPSCGEVVRDTLLRTRLTFDSRSGERTPAVVAWGCDCAMTTVAPVAGDTTVDVMIHTLPSSAFTRSAAEGASAWAVPAAPGDARASVRHPRAVLATATLPTVTWRQSAAVVTDRHGPSEIPAHTMWDEDLVTVCEDGLVRVLAREQHRAMSKAEVQSYLALRDGK